MLINVSASKIEKYQYFDALISIVFYYCFHTEVFLKPGRLNGLTFTFLRHSQICFLHENENAKFHGNHSNFISQTFTVGRVHIPDSPLCVYVIVC